VGGGDHILELLAGEDVNGQEIALGVAVLPRLGDRDVEHLAGLSLDHHVAALLDGSGLHRDDLGRSGVGVLDGIILVRHFLAFFC